MINSTGIWVENGATRLIVGTKDKDYILKIQPPYADVGNFDYCAQEAEIYAEAVKCGFSDKFAWCEHLLNYDLGDMSLPVYIMEWCDCSYNKVYDVMDSWHYSKYCTTHGVARTKKTYEDYRKSHKENYEGYSKRMIEWAYDCWGLDYNAPIGNDLTMVQFMCMMYIGDIHAGNWGWRDGRLVLVDYAGYGSDLANRYLGYC